MTAAGRDDPRNSARPRCAAPRVVPKLRARSALSSALGASPGPSTNELSSGLFQAEARLAAKRAARAEARDIRMKELERQQKEVRRAAARPRSLGVPPGPIARVSLTFVQGRAGEGACQTRLPQTPDPWERGTCLPHTASPARMPPAWPRAPASDR